MSKVKVTCKAKQEDKSLRIADTLNTRIQQGRMLVDGWRDDLAAIQSVNESRAESRVMRFRAICELADIHAGLPKKVGFGSWILATIPDADQSKEHLGRFNGYYSRAFTVARALVGKPQTAVKAAEDLLRKGGWDTIATDCRESPSVKQYMPDAKARTSKARATGGRLNVSDVNPSENPVQFLAGVRSLLQNAIGHVKVAGQTQLGMVRDEIGKLQSVLDTYRESLPDPGMLAPAEDKAPVVVKGKGKGKGKVRPLPAAQDALTGRTPYQTGKGKGKGKHAAPSTSHGPLGPVPMQSAQ